jgi:hypothetical protein
MREFGRIETDGWSISLTRVAIKEPVSDWEQGNVFGNREMGKRPTS